MASTNTKLEDQISEARQRVEAGEIDQAVALCRHIFRYYPRCLEVTRILGEAYTEKRLLDQADRLLAFVLEADPQDVLGYVDRGFAAYERNQLDESISFYERALELDPNIEQLRGELLRLNRERYGDNRSKLRLTRAGLANRRLRDGYYSQAIEEYTAILRDTPDRPDIRVGLLEANWRNRDYARTESLALELLSEQPYLIKANLLLWQIYGVRRHLEKANSYLEQAQKLDPLNVVAEHLFAEAEASDNALHYLSLLEAPMLPVYQADPNEPPLGWLPNWLTSSEPSEDQPSEALASPGDDQQSVSFADLGLDIMSLIADSEQHTADRLNQIQAAPEPSQPSEADQTEALNNLDELRREAGQENEFGGWLEELSANAPQIDLNASQADKAKADAVLDIAPFDLNLGEEHAELYQLFDDLEAAEQARGDAHWFGEDASQSQDKPIDDSLTAQQAKWQEIDLDLDIQPFEPEAAMATEPLSFDQPSTLEGSSQAVVSPDVTVNPSEANPQNQVFEQKALDQAAAVAPTAQPTPYVVQLRDEQGLTVTPTAQPYLPYAIELRDEQGSIPDFVLQATPTTSDDAPQQVSKENAQMPIRKGGNEDNELFDWEKEELPDYLQAFAMSEDDAAKFGLATPTAPQADITTPPARIRPRDMEVTGENEVPDWLNPNPARSSSRNGEFVDLSGGSRQNIGGGLPGWLDAADLEDNKTGSGIGSNLENFDLEDIQPFTPFGDDFGATAAPPKPSQNNTAASSFQRDNDIQPFSLDNFQSGALQSPTPAAPQRSEPPSFNLTGLDDFDLGDLQPFSPEGGASTVGPTSSMSANSKQPTSPLQSTSQTPSSTPPKPPTQPFAFSKPPTQPLSPSPRPPSIPRQNTPTPSAFDDLADLQPFDLSGNSRPSENSRPNSSTPANSPFEPNFPLMPTPDAGGFQSFDLNTIKPFSVEGFGASSPPSASGNNGKNVSKDSDSDFNFQDDFGPDLEPFSMEGFGDIPGLSKDQGRFNNFNSMPDEPFYPTPTRRPRENDAPQPMEPGQEAPLRQFPWMKNRQESQRTRDEEREEGQTLFKRLSERRRQDVEEQGNTPATPLNQGDEQVQPILSFDEVEALSQRDDKFASMPTPPDTQPFRTFDLGQSQPAQSVSKANQQINDQLNQGLEDDTFDWALDAALQQPSNAPELPSQKFEESALPDFDANFDLEPFDLTEIAPPSVTSKPTSAFSMGQKEAEPPLPDFDFEQGQPNQSLKSEPPVFNLEQEAAGQFSKSEPPVFNFEQNQLDRSAMSEMPTFNFEQIPSNQSNQSQQPEPPAFNFEQSAPSTFDFSSTGFDLAAGSSPAANQEANPFADLAQFEDFDAFAARPNNDNDLFPDIFDQPVTLPAETSSKPAPIAAEPFQMPEIANAATTTPVAASELPPVQIQATPPQITPPPAEVALPVTQPAVQETKFAQAATPIQAQPIVTAPTGQVQPPSNASAHSDNATVSSNEGNNGKGKAKTLEGYLQLVKNNPRDAQATMELADVYYQQGQANQAITYYTGAIRVADKPTLEKVASRLRIITKEVGSNPRFHHVLGDVYMKQGQTNLALNEYKLALSTAKAR